MKVLIFIGGLLTLAAAFLAINHITAPSLNQYAERTSVVPDGGCRKEPGFIAGPLVAKAETAQRIFEAVALGLGGSKFMAKYKIAVAEEAGYWAVYQSLPPASDSCEFAKPGATRCSITSGGGGLSMRIDKCSGAVSHVHYQR